MYWSYTGIICTVKSTSSQNILFRFAYFDFIKILICILTWKLWCLFSLDRLLNKNIMMLENKITKRQRLKRDIHFKIFISCEFVNTCVNDPLFFDGKIYFIIELRLSKIDVLTKYLTFGWLKYKYSGVGYLK